MRSLLKEKGESRSFLVMSLINGILYTVWTFAYYICILLRNQAFNTAQTNMMISGYSTYTVEVTSPFFGVLKVVAFLLPVILAVWTVMLTVNDKKRKQLCDKWLIFAVFAVDLICALTVTADVTLFHMIFA